MSVTKLPGTRGYLVRWRDSAGHSRSKTVLRQRDAFALDGEMKRKKALGELVTHERGDILLCDLYDLWWQRHALVSLSPRTRDVYGRLWRCHVDPALGTRQLRALRPEMLADFAAKLDLAPASVIRVLAILSNVLECAIDWDYLGSNPVKRVKRPKANHRRGRAISYRQIAQLIDEFPDLRSRVLTLVLAHTGLRPGELRALYWFDVKNFISVTKAVSGNQIGPTKTGKTRSVVLRSEALVPLKGWYMAQGQPAAEDLIFPGKDGRLWSDNAYSLWGHRKFGPAAARAGLKGLQPYDLRHTFVSTMLAEGQNIAWIAQQTGHSVRTMTETYAHLIESVASVGYDKAALPWIRSADGAK